jgi:hypothetical protein
MEMTSSRFFKFILKMDLTLRYQSHDKRFEIIFGRSWGKLFGTSVSHITSEDSWFRFDDERERELVTAVNLKRLFS